MLARSLKHTVPMSFLDIIAWSEGALMRVRNPLPPGLPQERSSYAPPKRLPGACAASLDNHELYRGVRRFIAAQQFWELCHVTLLVRCRVRGNWFSIGRRSRSVRVGTHKHARIKKERELLAIEILKTLKSPLSKNFATFFYLKGLECLHHHAPGKNFRTWRV